MDDLRVETLEGGRVRKLTDGSGRTYGDVVQAWRRDRAFRAAFLAALREAPFAAYFWEMPPVTRDTLGQAFECVLVDGPSLARMPAEPDAFAEHFRAAGTDEGVVTFPNLGGDAWLVAPSPSEPAAASTHLAAFVRGAPDDRQHALWRAVGELVAARVEERPRWLSTSGLGVGWLHVRLDVRPKYYTHGPYRDGA